MCETFGDAFDEGPVFCLFLVLGGLRGFGWRWFEGEEVFVDCEELVFCRSGFWLGDITLHASTFFNVRMCAGVDGYVHTCDTSIFVSDSTRRASSAWASLFVSVFMTSSDVLGTRLRRLQEKSIAKYKENEQVPTRRTYVRILRQSPSVLGAAYSEMAR